MTAKIITVCNQKGGSGKTTTCMQLAGTIGRRRGMRVLVVDADPQGTATRWAAAAPDETPFPAAVIGLAPAAGKIHREIKKFIRDYDYILVDCPPSTEAPSMQSALMVSDLALAPVTPSPPDLWASMGIRRVIDTIGDFNPELRARLLINGLQPRTIIAQEILGVLAEFGIPMCKTALRRRTVYQQAAAYGATVHRFGKKADPAIREINQLTRELLKLLQEHGADQEKSV